MQSTTSIGTPDAPVTAGKDAGREYWKILIVCFNFVKSKKERLQYHFSRLFWSQRSAGTIDAETFSEEISAFIPSLCDMLDVLDKNQAKALLDTVFDIKKLDSSIPAERVEERIKNELFSICQTIDAGCKIPDSFNTSSELAKKHFDEDSICMGSSYRIVVNHIMENANTEKVIDRFFQD